MSRAPKDVIIAFAGEIASRDVRRLQSYFADNVAARFDIAGEMVGRPALLAFWRRLFRSYALLELHIVRTVVEGDLVLAESVYLLGGHRTGILPVKAMSVFEVGDGLITRWRDYADLAEVPASETERWRRLGSARW